MEHLSQKQIEDYSLHQLNAAELLAVTDHLGDCELCRQRTESGANGDAAFFAMHEETLGADQGSHLTPEQTADYVDKNLSGESLQVVTDHLSACEMCVFAVEDLRAFRNEIAPSLDREYGPTSFPVPSHARASWREKFSSLFGVLPVPAFGAGLAILLLAVVAWIVWRMPKEQEPQVVFVPTPSPTVSISPSPEPQPEPAVVVAQLSDGGGTLALDQEGKLTGADNLPPAYQNLLKKTLSSQRIEKSSQLDGLTRPPSSLMGSDQNKGELSVLEPIGNVLLANRPTFRWSSFEGATGFVVEVYDEQFKQVATSPQLTDTSWTTTLPRGHVYSWQVKAIKEGEEIVSPRPPAPQAKFRVLDQAKANELMRAKNAYGSSHLTLGLLYAEAGLLKEAEQEFRLLRRANPNSDLARTLLRQVQALRR